MQQQLLLPSSCCKDPTQNSWRERPNQSPSSDLINQPHDHRPPRPAPGYVRFGSQSTLPERILRTAPLVTCSVPQRPQSNRHSPRPTPTSPTMWECTDHAATQTVAASTARTARQTRYHHYLVLLVPPAPQTCSRALEME